MAASDPRWGKAASRARAAFLGLVVAAGVPVPTAAEPAPHPAPLPAPRHADPSAPPELPETRPLSEVEPEGDDGSAGLDDEEAKFEAVRQGWLGRPLPEATLTSLDGVDMSFATARGEWLLLAFADRDARDEALAWFERHARRLAEADRLQVLSLLFPGKIGFVVPRAVAQKKILEDVRRILRRSRQGLPEELRPRFDQRRLLWHVDWRRRLSSELGAPRHRLCLMLADPEGRVVAVEDRVDEAALARLLDRAGTPMPPSSTGDPERAP